MKPIRGSSVTNYGEFWRNEETIATGFMESVVNQIVSKRFAKLQQMQWTNKGAHLVLQTRNRLRPMCAALCARSPSLEISRSITYCG